MNDVLIVAGGTDRQVDIWSVTRPVESKRLDATVCFNYLSLKYISIYSFLTARQLHCLFRGQNAFLCWRL